MDYVLEPTGSALEVRLSGKLTLRDHDSFRDLMADISDLTGFEGDRIVFDMADLEFVDSAGLGMFLVAQDMARSRSLQVVLRSPQAPVRRLLEVACFHTLFTIEG